MDWFLPGYETVFETEGREQGSEGISSPSNSVATLQPVSSCRHGSYHSVKGSAGKRPKNIVFYVKSFVCLLCHFEPGRTRVMTGIRNTFLAAPLLPFCLRFQTSCLWFRSLVVCIAHALMQVRTMSLWSPYSTQGTHPQPLDSFSLESRTAQR